MVSFDEVQKLKEFLSSPKKIVITTHHKPDGDALGSSLAMLRFLTRTGHQAFLVTPTDYPKFLEWLPGNDLVQIWTEQKEICTKLLQNADAVFCFDFNVLKRINEMGEVISKLNCLKVLVDHHPEPSDFPDISYWSTLACSTCELVYDLMIQLDAGNYLDAETATCLYTGIMTDTDNFHLPNTTGKVHRIVADLMERGVNAGECYRQIFETYSVNRLRFFGECMKEKIEFYDDIKAGIMCLDKDDLSKYGITTGDTEGLVNLPLKVEGILLSALIVRRPDMVKLSLRSRGDFDVNKICREHFNGGGHKNAAGGNSDVGVAETKIKLLSILAPLKNLILQNS